jgi:hypothetical protein
MNDVNISDSGRFLAVKAGLVQHIQRFSKDTGLQSEKPLNFPLNQTRIMTLLSNIEVLLSDS